MAIKKPAKPAKKAAPAAKAIAAKTFKDPVTKSQLISTLADSTNLSRKDVTAVIAELTGVIEGHLKKNGAGIFVLPGMLKIKRITKPATKARKGINPFTGTEMMFKAKPARNVVKILPLKAVKEMVK